jgi:DNA-binding NtrC family response regulator
MLDRMPAGGHDARMRTRIPITNDQVTAALNDSDGDVKDAADRLGVSERTLRRRMRDYGIKARVRYEEAA